MSKLLRANFSRLGHDRAFRLLSALMAFFGTSMAVVNAVHARQDGEIWVMDYTIFIYVILAPIVNAVMTESTGLRLCRGLPVPRLCTAAGGCRAAFEG